jgi:hypothetical protein
MTTRTDLLALWAWEYDEPFIHMVRVACAARGVSIHVCGGTEGISVDDLRVLSSQLDTQELCANAVLDRVWDWGGEYESHVGAVQRCIPHVLNPYDRVRAIWDRTYVHYLFMQHGLRVPYLVQLPSLTNVPHPVQADLSMLNHRFSVKGAFSGGSGVLTPTDSWEAILERRREWPEDRTLVQEWIEPRMLDNRRAWFRVFYACGTVLPCWQDDRTHVQTPVSAREMDRFGLSMLYSITQQIAGLSMLNLFSTEIALDERGHWVVVDYINDPCDYRPQSTIANGVPDSVLAAIADRIAAWVKKTASANG